jgi:hypothetical protein
MPCEEYGRLQQESESARQRYAQFTFRENIPLRGVSDRKAREIAKVEKEKQIELSKKMYQHREVCAACKAESVRAPEKD